MAGVVQPPYGSPTGPELSFQEVVSAFLEGRRHGFCPELHIEDDMLLAERMVPCGVRIGTSSLLLRVDVPPSAGPILRAVAEHLRESGLEVVDPDADLGDVAAIQVTGVRGGCWDLWGDIADAAREALRRAALGGEEIGLDMEETRPDAAPGMTLEELLGDGPPPRHDDPEGPDDRDD